MGEYQVSKENYEEFVQSVILKRLEEDILWGFNANVPQDALTFAEECFTEGIDDAEVKAMIGDYLLRNGFSRMSAGKASNLVTLYTFPNNPKGEFVEILDKYVQSYESACKAFKDKASSEVREWLASERKVTCFRTGNAFFRQYVLEELDRFPYILKEQTDMGGWVYARKTVPERKRTERLTYPVSNISAEIEEKIRYFESSVQYEIKRTHFDNYLATQYKVGEVKPIPTKYIVYVFELRLEAFMEGMRKEGYEVSFFPLHPHSAYVNPAVRAPWSVPVYVNVPTEIMERFEYLAMKAKMN